MPEKQSEPLFTSCGELHDVGPVLDVDAVLETYAAARAVIERWDADDVDAGMMDDDIDRLRRAIGED